MEKIKSSSYPNYYTYNNKNKLKPNLKHLPPIDPYSITSAKKYQVKHEIPNCRIAKTMPKEEMKGGDGDSLNFSTKYIDPNSTSKSETSGYEDVGISQNDSKIEGAPKKVSAKSKLLEICAANHWKPPSFECCKEEGPCHTRLFTYKVTFVIESLNTTLECFGAPQSKKKTAAEHAAEGALWYLQHLGYFPIKKRKN